MSSSNIAVKMLMSSELVLSFELPITILLDTLLCKWSSYIGIHCVNGKVTLSSDFLFLDDSHKETIIKFDHIELKRPGMNFPRFCKDEVFHTV